MRRDPRVLLMDIEQAGADIARFTEGIEIGIYLEDAMMQAAVERKFGIIGEALNRLRKDHPGVTQRIPRLSEIIDFRNVLVHGYDHVVPGLIWDYAETHLPQLRRIGQALLDELGPPED